MCGDILARERSEMLTGADLLAQVPNRWQAGGMAHLIDLSKHRPTAPPLPRLYQEVWELPRRRRKWSTATMVVLAVSVSALLTGALGAFLDGP